LLPELTRELESDCQASGRHHQPDVIIRTGKLQVSNLQPTDSRLLCSIEKNFAYLYWHEVGTVLIKDGQEIIVDLIGDIDYKVLRIMLLGAAFGLLLHQRGFIVIHGNSVNINGKGVCFVGNRGFGKSTISAGFHFKGYSLISDDITAIRLNNSSKACLIPGYGRLKLWQDSVEALGLKSQDLSLVHPQYEKREYLIDGSLSTQPVSLDCIYILDCAEELAIESIPPTEALFKVMQNCYCTRFGTEMHKTLSAAEHFHQGSSLLNCSKVFTLKRTNDLTALPQLIELVEQHIAKL